MKSLIPVSTLAAIALAGCAGYGDAQYAKAECKVVPMTTVGAGRHCGVRSRCGCARQLTSAGSAWTATPPRHTQPSKASGGTSIDTTA